MKVKRMIVLGVIVSLLLVFTGCGSSKTEYYKNEEFVSENTGEVVYETKNKNLSWGAYQKETSELTEECMELHAGAISLSKSKEEFDSKVSRFKEKLDILESDYAFGYSSDEGDVIKIKIDDSKLGLPVFAILNINHSSENMIVSPMGDMTVKSVKNFSYTLNENSQFDITVEVPNSEQEKLAQYISKNPDTTLYLKLGDLTFSSVSIKEGMPSDKVTFSGLEFLGSSVREADYEFIMILTEYVVNNPDDGLFSMDFPNEIEDEVEYKVPYITAMDEVIIANINSLYDDVVFTREGVQNNIAIRFNIDPEKEDTVMSLNRIYKIYNLCGFDDGAYSTVSFRWPSGKIGTNNYVFFTKRNGKMVCGGYADRIKEEVKNDKFISQYIE